MLYSAVNPVRFLGTKPCAGCTCTTYWCKTLYLTLTVLVRFPDALVLRQIDKDQFSQSLVQLLTHIDENVRAASRTLVFKLSEDSVYRPSLVDAGVLAYFMQKLDDPEHDRLQVLSTICLYTVSSAIAISCWRLVSWKSC